MADDSFTVMLEKPVAGGRSLARLDGRVVLVSGGIPGERVRVVLEKAGKGVAFARVVEVEEASSLCCPLEDASTALPSSRMTQTSSWRSCKLEA